MDQTPANYIGEIEASLNYIPFDSCATIGPREAAPDLTRTWQFNLVGLSSWLITVTEGVHTSVRCDGVCDLPPDATLACSPETYLQVVRRHEGMNAETALHQGLIEIGGDWGPVLAIVGESFRGGEAWWRARMP